MHRRVVLSLSIVVLLSIGAPAAEIHLVYPRLEQGQDTFRYAPDLDSSFVLGQVTGARTGSKLLCNGHSVEMAEDGAFLAFLPLGNDRETNNWYFSLIEGETGTSQLEFPYGRLPSANATEWVPLEPPVWYAISESNAHTRTTIGGSYHLFPEVGTPLRVVAISDKWAEFEIEPGNRGVIEKRFLATNTEAKLDQKGQIRVGDGIVNANECEAVITFGVDRMPLWEVDVESLWSFVVTLHDAVSTVDRIRFTADAAKLIRDVTWKQRGNALEIRVDCHLARFQGYRIHASDSVIQFAMIRPRTMKSGLRGKKIAVDPGHGGGADGAIGPRGTKEKDVVLRWAHILERTLHSAGADVVLTRNSDSAVSLYERIEIARNADCDLFLSLHANALPDGENPAERHGCGVYYYNTLSRKLAETVQSQMIKATHLDNDGLFDANLAVIRPTDFPAVLIESAYMMHPEEELMLQDDKFLSKLSRGIKLGLQEYFNNVSSR